MASGRSSWRPRRRSSPATKRRTFSARWPRRTPKRATSKSAKKWSQKAVELSQKDVEAAEEDDERKQLQTDVEQLQKELDSYEEGKPVRERQTAEDAADETAYRRPHAGAAVEPAAARTADF